MDKYTRNYLIILVSVALIVLLTTFYQSPKVSALNDRLRDDPELLQYPYRFRVLDLENGVATMTTPRAANFSAFSALRILFDDLADESVDSPALYEAQNELARIQGIAERVVRADPEVQRIAWKLDDRWLRANGVNPDLL